MAHRANSRKKERKDVTRHVESDMSCAYCIPSYHALNSRDSSIVTNLPEVCSLVALLIYIQLLVTELQQPCKSRLTWLNMKLTEFSTGTGACSYPKWRAPVFPMSVCINLEWALVRPVQCYKRVDTLPRIRHESDQFRAFAVDFPREVVCSNFTGAVCEHWEGRILHCANAGYWCSNQYEARPTASFKERPDGLKET